MTARTCGRRRRSRCTISQWGPPVRGSAPTPGPAPDRRRRDGRAGSPPRPGPGGGRLEGDGGCPGHDRLAGLPERRRDPSRLRVVRLLLGIGDPARRGALGKVGPAVGGAGHGADPHDVEIPVSGRPWRTARSASRRPRLAVWSDTISSMASPSGSGCRSGPARHRARNPPAHSPTEMRTLAGRSAADARRPWSARAAASSCSATGTSPSRRPSAACPPAGGRTGARCRPRPRTGPAGGRRSAGSGRGGAPPRGASPPARQPGTAGHRPSRASPDRFLNSPRRNRGAAGAGSYRYGWRRHHRRKPPCPTS